MEQTPPSTDRRRQKVHHFNEPGHAHFLTFSCYRRLPLLSKDRSCGWLIEAIQAARGKHGFDLWAWVVMPEHVHLLLWPREPNYCMKAILADIKRPVGQEAIAWLEANHSEFLARLPSAIGTVRIDDSGRRDPAKTEMSLIRTLHIRFWSTSTIIRCDEVLWVCRNTGPGRVPAIGPARETRRLRRIKRFRASPCSSRNTPATRLLHCFCEAVAHMHTRERQYVPNVP